MNQFTKKQDHLFFVDPEEIEYNGKKVIALTVASDGITHATTDGRCLKRLGKNSKPFYPDEMSNRYSEIQSSDFSGRILSDSTEDDINKLEVYKLKEKLKARNPESTLADMDDIAFLRDLALIKYDGNNIKLTVAGLLFVGKEQSINRLLPQAEVIYLHYSETNLEEYDARLDMKAPIISVIDRLSEKNTGFQPYSKCSGRTFQTGNCRLSRKGFSGGITQCFVTQRLSKSRCSLCKALSQ